MPFDPKSWDKLEKLAQAKEDPDKAVLLYLYGESPWLAHRSCAERSIKRDGFGYDYRPVANPRKEPCRLCYAPVPPT